MCSSISQWWNTLTTNKRDWLSFFFEFFLSSFIARNKTTDRRKLSIRNSLHLAQEVWGERQWTPYNGWISMTCPNSLQWIWVNWSNQLTGIEHDLFILLNPVLHSRQNFNDNLQTIAEVVSQDISPIKPTKENPEPRTEVLNKRCCCGTTSLRLLQFNLNFLCRSFLCHITTPLTYIYCKAHQW